MIKPTKYRYRCTICQRRTFPSSPVIGSWYFCFGHSLKLCQWIFLQRAEWRKRKTVSESAGTDATAHVGGGVERNIVSENRRPAPEKPYGLDTAWQIRKHELNEELAKQKKKVRR